MHIVFRGPASEQHESKLGTEGGVLEEAEEGAALGQGRVLDASFARP